MNDELLERREFLLRSLEDLARERDAGDLSPGDWQTLHDQYAARLEEVQAAIAGKPVTPPAATRSRKPIAVLVALSVGLAAVGAGVFVANNAGSRDPGDTLSGDIRDSSAGQLAEAAALVRQGKSVEALELYDDVIAGDPRNVEAHAERGLLLISLAGAAERPRLAEEGRRSIEEALRLDPNNARTLFYLGLALRLEGQTDGAREMFERALATDPSPTLRADIERFLAGLDEP